MERLGAVIIIAVLVLLTALCGPRAKPGQSCYTDWDGRSNPTVCE